MNKNSIVSIPFTSGNSFLLIRLLNSKKKWKGCQSPSRRGTHFYVEIDFGLHAHVTCQSPSRRGTHFYGRRKKMANNTYQVSIPFTSGNSFLRTGRWRCTILAAAGVNPLHVGELISTAFDIWYEWDKSLCQSPSRRGTHFYDYNESSNIW